MTSLTKLLFIMYVLFIDIVGEREKIIELETQ